MNCSFYFMEGENNKVRYKQPYHIKLSTGNSALDSKLREKAHFSDKVWANMSNSQKKTAIRRERILDLASMDQLYCAAHSRYLCVKDILEKKCYMRHGSPPVCKYLMQEKEDGLLKPYGK